ncbi:Uncharacterised protein [Mycobacteroides abscessus]|nr:Uncharacterised protein [Mycobacteroides abscessus]
MREYGVTLTERTPFVAAKETPSAIVSGSMLRPRPAQRPTEIVMRDVSYPAAASAAVSASTLSASCPEFWK